MRGWTEIIPLRIHHSHIGKVTKMPRNPITQTSLKKKIRVSIAVKQFKYRKNPYWIPKKPVLVSEEPFQDSYKIGFTLGRKQKTVLSGNFVTKQF